MLFDLTFKSVDVSTLIQALPLQQHNLLFWQLCFKVFFFEYPTPTHTLRKIAKCSLATPDLGNPKSKA